MSVYIDSAFIRYRGMRMCHMLADTIEELHVMAARIGVKRRWFQNRRVPHYDICMAKRKLAVSYGAVEITRHQLVEKIRASA